MKRKLKFYLVCTLLFAAAVTLFASAASSSVKETRTVHRRFDPVEIDGVLLEKFLGKPLSHLRLLAFRDGVLAPVPYQFDERSEDYVFVLPEGSKGFSEGANGILDPQDILVFMITDVGDRVEAAKLCPAADRMAEISITDPIDRSQGWVYLAYYKDRKQAPEANFKPKVWLEDNPESFITHGFSYCIEGFVNEIQGRIYKTAINNRFYVPTEAGGNGVNLFDRMKTRAFASLFFGLLKLTVNENNIIGELDQYRVSPVRGYGRNWLQATVPLKIAYLKSPKMYLDIFCYDTMILIPMVMHVFINPQLAGVSGGMSFGYDLNESAYGMKFYNSENTDGFIIDGKMSPPEENMNHTIDEWRCITGPQGTMITSSVWDKNYLNMASVDINYIDDLKVNIEPEGIPGQIGYHYNTSRATWAEPGWYDALLCWYFPPHFYDPTHFHREVITEYSDMRDRPLLIEIGDHIVKNPGGWPDLLLPKRSSH